MTRMFNPPHPGLTLRDDVLPALGLSVTEAAEQLGVGRQALSRMLNGRGAISTEMALRIEQWLGVDRGGRADLWLAQQAAFDLWQARKAVAPKKFRRSVCRSQLTPTGRLELESSTMPFRPRIPGRSVGTGPALVGRRDPGADTRCAASRRFGTLRPTPPTAGVGHERPARPILKPSSGRRLRSTSHACAGLAVSSTRRALITAKVVFSVGFPRALKDR